MNGVERIRNEYLEANDDRVVFAAAALAYNLTLDDPRECKRGYEMEAALLAAAKFFPELVDGADGLTGETMMDVTRAAVIVLQETRGRTVEEVEKAVAH